MLSIAGPVSAGVAAHNSARRPGLLPARPANRHCPPLCLTPALTNEGVTCSREYIQSNSDRLEQYHSQAGQAAARLRREARRGGQQPITAPSGTHFLLLLTVDGLDDLQQQLSSGDQAPGVRVLVTHCPQRGLQGPSPPPGCQASSFIAISARPAPCRCTTGLCSPG